MTLSIKNARAFALKAHKGQKDKSGRPYYEHLDAVRMGVQVLGGGKDAEIAALFHDIVEDTKVTLKDLKDLGASEETLVIVEALTKKFSEEQGKYLARIIAAGPGAMRVKVADLLHNTRHDRMAALPEQTRDRLMKKYRPALATLMLELNMIVDEEEHGKLLAKKPKGSATGYGWETNSKGEMSVTGSSIIRGDWPKGWKAPVLAYATYGPKSRLLLLADNTYKIVGMADRLVVKTEHNWDKETKHAEIAKVFKATDLFEAKDIAERAVLHVKKEKATKTEEQAVL